MVAAHIHALLEMVVLQDVMMLVEAAAQLFALTTARHLVLLIVNRCVQIVVAAVAKRHQQLQ